MAERIKILGHRTADKRPKISAMLQVTQPQPAPLSWARLLNYEEDEHSENNGTKD